MNISWPQPGNHQQAGEELSNFPETTGWEESSRTPSMWCCVGTAFYSLGKQALAQTLVGAPGRESMAPEMVIYMQEYS